jgi:RNA polymerase sigma-70 factor (ECF subfamily)
VSAGARPTESSQPPAGADADAGDRALVAAYLTQRDEASFRALYRRHTPALWPFVLRLVGGDEETAREAMQETWIRAARGLDAFRWEARLRTWLTGIALNCAREATRHERRARGGAPGPDPRAGGELAVAPAAASGYSIDLARAVDALPEGYRRVLLLHDVEGYTHEEIGSILGIDIGTSKSQLHHARRRLRAVLAAGGEVEP